MAGQLDHPNRLVGPRKQLFVERGHGFSRSRGRVVFNAQGQALFAHAITERIEPPSCVSLLRSS